MTGREQLSVEHVGNDRFTVRVRGHAVFVDQPREAGGFDTAPTPTDLFAGALASCVAFYARRYLARHHLPEDGLAVTASYAMADRPARVAEIAIAVAVPETLSAEQRRALLAVASHCTVHNTLQQPPDVSIELDRHMAVA
jgi:putative redox protein